MFQFETKEDVVKFAANVVRKAMPKRLDLSDDSKLRKYLSLSKTLGDTEKFTMLYLDPRLRLIAVEDLFEGNNIRVEVDYRRIAAQILKHNAFAVVVSHNHPLSEATPSDPDIMMTRQLGTFLNMLNVNLIDHYVVAGMDGSVVSIKEYLQEKAKPNENEEESIGDFSDFVRHMMRGRRKGILPPIHVIKG